MAHDGSTDPVRRTSDGVNIAYWLTGEGAAVLVTAPLAQPHLALEWQVPDLAAWYKRMAAQCTLAGFLRASRAQDGYLRWLRYHAAVDVDRVYRIAVTVRDLARTSAEGDVR